MGTEQKATRLSIFVSEADYYRGRPVEQLVVERAREQGLAGATVIRGWAGFGESGDFRIPTLWRSRPRPLVIEMVDRPERIDAFLDTAEELLRWALVTREAVVMTRYDRAPPRSR